MLFYLHDSWRSFVMFWIALVWLHSRELDKIMFKLVWSFMSYMLLLFPIKLVKLKIVNDTVTSIIGKRGKTMKDTIQRIQMYWGLTFLRVQGSMLIQKKIRSAPADYEQRDTHIVDVVVKLKQSLQPQIYMHRCSP